MMSVNPYLGTDGVMPFVNECAENKKGIFVLVKTSNKSSGELQDLKSGGKYIYEHMAELVKKWGSDLVGTNGYSSVGAVVGATYPEQAASLREQMPRTYFLVPGYIISLAISFFVPPIYTGVAFDSGGVASGPMTSGFILPFAIGICTALQGENAVLRDGFGVVAMVAMVPLITIQLLGFKAIVSNMIKEKRAMKRILKADDEYIINFM